MGKTIIYREISREYEEKRDNAKKLAQQRKMEVYKKCPKIEQIDNEIGEIGLKGMRNALEMTAKEEREAYLEKIKSRNESLIDEKCRLMMESGFPKDYLTAVYECEECKDTGLLNNKKCKCYLQKVIDKVYAMSNLGDKLKVENFDNFDIRYYSTEIDPSEGISPFENIQSILLRSMKFSKEFGKNCHNLLFYGGAGLGKTYLCNCIAKDLLDRGYTVVYTTAFQLFKMVENEKFNKGEAEKVGNFLSLIEEADLLIIDDLGTEFNTILSASEFFNLVNSRLIEKKPTIISTNLSPEALAKQYSDRVVSRIYGEYTLLRFFGEDIRILKKMKK